MVPNTRELVWFGLGVVGALFVWPRVKGLLGQKS